MTARPLLARWIAQTVTPNGGRTPFLTAECDPGTRRSAVTVDVEATPDRPGGLLHRVR